MKTEFAGWLNNELANNNCGMAEDIIKVHNKNAMKEYAKDKMQKETLFSYVATSLEDFEWLLKEVGFTILDILKQVDSYPAFNADDKIFYLGNEGHDIFSGSDMSDAVECGLIDIEGLAEYIWNSEDEDCTSIVEEYEDDIMSEEE